MQPLLPDLSEFTHLCDALCSQDDTPVYARLLTAVRNRDALAAGVCIIIIAEQHKREA